MIFVETIGAIDEFDSENRSSEQLIQTTFGLEVIFESDKSDDISVESISFNISWESPEDNNTLDIFFNVSSIKPGMANLTLVYHFDYSFGARAAAFYPETLTFAEISDGEIKDLNGADVALVEKTVSMDINITHNQTRSFTITGDLDLEPPDVVEIKSIEVEKEGEATIYFFEVLDNEGYYLYLTEKKCVNAQEEDPYNHVPFNYSPVGISHLKLEQEIYISISAIDFAGNINPQVDCHKFVMTLPNLPPIAKIDALKGDFNAGELVYFTCKYTDDPDSDGKLAYSWDLDGDGKEDSTDENPNFIYETSGDYQVTLTVTDKAGLDDTDSMDITILESENVEETVEKDERKQNYIVLGAVIGGIVFIISVVMIVKKRKRSTPAVRKGRAGGKEKIKFLKKEREGKDSNYEGRELREGDRTEPEPVEQIFRKLDVVEGFGGDEGLASEREMIKFLPMRASPRPPKQKKKKGRGRRRKSKKRSEKSPLVAAVSMEFEPEAEKSKSLYACPKCDEVLEVAINAKSGTMDERYNISCPICNTKGEIVVE